MRRMIPEARQARRFKSLQCPESMGDIQWPESIRATADRLGTVQGISGREYITKTLFRKMGNRKPPP
jgi:hypothetical protein